MESLTLSASSSRTSTIGDTLTLRDVFIRYNFNEKFPYEFFRLENLLKEITDVNEFVDRTARPMSCCLWTIATSLNSAPFEVLKLFSLYGVDMNAPTAFGNLLIDLIIQVKYSQWSSNMKKLMLMHVRFNTNADYEVKINDKTPYDFAVANQLEYDQLLPLFIPLTSIEKENRKYNPVRPFQMIPVAKQTPLVIKSNIRVKRDPV